MLFIRLAFRATNDPGTRDVTDIAQMGTSTINTANIALLDHIVSRR